MEDPTPWTAALDGPPSEALAALVSRVHVASLGVLDAGAPAVSLVPFAVLPEPWRFVLVVSDLSAHTSALRTGAPCSLLVHEPWEQHSTRNVHALVRLSVVVKPELVTRARAAEEGLERA